MGRGVVAQLGTWMRAAVIIYALFFGLRPFPGLDHVAAMLFSTPIGWAMLIAGSVAGGIFAAFSFAISTFSIPMLLDEKTDAFTAMGTSISLVWNNLPVMLAWGAIVLALFLVSVVTGLLGLIVVFPLLGHATWHLPAQHFGRWATQAGPQHFYRCGKENWRRMGSRYRGQFGWNQNQPRRVADRSGGE